MAAAAAFDAIVVGGGIVGVATAWRLALRGQRTLLIERFPSITHDRGSSHGCSRIIRRTYPQRHYMEAMPSAYALWAEAEGESGVRVITRTGGLDFARAGNPGIAALVAGCDRYDVPYERLTPAAVRKRFPLLRLPDEYEAVYSPEAGSIHADAARAMLADLAQRRGCTILTGHAVTDIVDDGGQLRVESAGAGGAGDQAVSFRAPACVLTAGPWAGPLLARLSLTARSPWAQLPLRPKKVRTSYWQLPAARAAELAATPVLIDYDAEGKVYGMPTADGCIKLGLHDGPYFDDADARDDVDDAHAEAAVREFVRASLPDVDADAGPRRTEHCAYTMTPDEDYVLDAMRTPGGGRLVLGAGFSGHGFKLAPWCGDVLASLATDGAAAHTFDLSHFRADRDFGSFEDAVIHGQRRAPS